MKGSFSRLFEALRGFRFARAGNVAITFGILALPLIGGVGAAVDYSRANWAKSKMQGALDSSALLLSKEAANESLSQLQAHAQSYFTANFNMPGITNINVGVTYTNTSGSKLVVNASASLPAEFVSVLGVNSFNLTASSTAKWSDTKLRVALVLDNTGSMSQSDKITELKAATSNLLTQLQNAVVNPGDAYVSIVPFVNAVNLNPTNYAASWIDWTDWNAVNGKCSSTKYTTQSTCVAAKKMWTASNHNTWNGCVTDRGLPILTGGSDLPSVGNYDENVSQPVAGNLATLYPAYQAPSCPQVAMGLNYDWSTMATLVNNMAPGGSTDQPIGLVWGWQTLVGGGPFTAPTMDPDYNYSQVIILLSDGLNTQDRWYGNGSATSTQVDSRMYDSHGDGTCANIKAAGITIYTVQVSTDGTPLSTLLQDCATDSSRFFFLTSSDQIVTTFNTIGTSLTQLYLSQ
jgi:Flp pilus assembly protein TadG